MSFTEIILIHTVLHTCVYIYIVLPVATAADAPEHTQSGTVGISPPLTEVGASNGELHFQLLEQGSTMPVKQARM